MSFDAKLLYEFLEALFLPSNQSETSFRSCNKCSNLVSSEIKADLLFIQKQHHIAKYLLQTYQQFLSLNKAKKKVSGLLGVNAEIKEKLSTKVSKVEPLKATKFLNQDSKKSLAVALVGPRKSGKTTIMKHMFRDFSVCQECRNFMQIRQVSLSEIRVHASFFLQNTSKFLNSIVIAIISISLQLQANIKAFSSDLLPKDLKDLDQMQQFIDDIDGFSVEKLFYTLIVEPVAVLETSEPICVMFDGLETLKEKEYREITGILCKLRSTQPKNLILYFTLASEVEIIVNRKGGIERRFSQSQLSYLKKHNVTVHSTFNSEKTNAIFISDNVRSKLVAATPFIKTSQPRLLALEQEMLKSTNGLISNIERIDRIFKSNPQTQAEFDFSNHLFIENVAKHSQKCNSHDINSVIDRLESILDKRTFVVYLLPLLCCHPNQPVEFKLLIRLLEKQDSFQNILNMLAKLIYALEPIYEVNCSSSDFETVASLQLPSVDRMITIKTYCKKLFDISEKSLNEWTLETKQAITDASLQSLLLNEPEQSYAQTNALADLLKANRHKDSERLITQSFQFLYNAKIVQILQNAIKKYPLFLENRSIRTIYTALMKSQHSIKHPNNVIQVLMGRLGLSEQIKVEKVFKAMNKFKNNVLTPLTNSLQRASLPVSHSLNFDRFSSIGVLMRVFFIQQLEVVIACFQTKVLAIRISPNSYSDFQVVEEISLSTPLIDAFQVYNYTAVITEERVYLLNTQKRANALPFVIHKHFKLQQLLKEESKVALTLTRSHILLCLSVNNDILLFTCQRETFSDFKPLGKQLIPGTREEQVHIRQFQCIRNNVLLFATSTGRIYTFMPQIKGRQVRIHINLCLHVQVQGEDDGIIKFLPTIGEKSLKLLVASESGLIGLYRLFKENGVSRAALEKEIKPGRSRKARESFDNFGFQSTLAFGASRVVSKKGLKLVVEDFSNAEAVKYNLPVGSLTVLLVEQDQTCSTFASLTENNRLFIWNLEVLESKKVGERAKSSVEESDTEEESEDDDFAFFLNINNDLEATNNLVDVAVATEDKLEEEDQEESSDEESDDEAFFLNTSKEIFSIKPEVIKSMRPSDSVSVSVASSGGSSKRKLFSKNRVRFNRISHDVFPEFWHEEWVSCMTLNEPKAVLTVGYKDGRLAVFSLNNSFFDRRKDIFGAVGLSNNPVQLVSERQLESDILAIVVSETGKYLACYTRSTLRVFSLSRGGYKVGKDKVDHLSLIWSQRRDSPLQTRISFSECNDFIKLAAEDESASPSLIVQLSRRRRIGIKALERRNVRWEAKSEVAEPEVVGNKVLKRGYEGFVMDGTENIFGLNSEYNKLLVVSQGSNLHFLRY